MSAIGPLFLLTILPLLAALFIMVGAQPRLTARVSSVLLFVLTCFLLFRYDREAGDFQFVSGWTVSEVMGLSLLFGADGLSLAMLFLASIVTVAAVWVIPPIKDRERLFYACILLISTGVVGAFASLDVLFFYAFHEVALIPTFLLIGIWGSGDRQAAAWKATIYLGLGSFVLLLGIIGLYLAMPAGIRSFDLRVIQEAAAVGVLKPDDWVYLLLLIGFGTLVSLFPFHSWAPQAYASAPTPAAMLHAGVLKKFGAYGLLRLALPVFPEAMQTYANLLLMLLIGNILVIGLVTISQKRLDWTLGYSSVMHMGYIFLGFAALNELSLSGAGLLMVAHGLSIAALFALSGAIRDKTGTLDFSELGGLAKVAPMLGLLFGFATMASIGLPGFANFPGELLVFFGAFSSPLAAPAAFGLSNFQWTTVVAVWGVVISAVYMLRAYRKVFFGTMPERWSSLTDLDVRTRYAVILLILAMLIIGFYPQPILELITPSILLP
jgi:NADH-quinone oxidoreductase subunit M